MKASLALAITLSVACLTCTNCSVVQSQGVKGYDAHRFSTQRQQYPLEQQRHHLLQQENLPSEQQLEQRRYASNQNQLQNQYGGGYRQQTSAMSRDRYVQRTDRHERRDREPAAEQLWSTKGGSVKSEVVGKPNSIFNRPREVEGVKG